MNGLEILVRTSKQIENLERIEVEKKGPAAFWSSFTSLREFDEMPASYDSVEFDSKDH